MKKIFFLLILTFFFVLSAEDFFNIESSVVVESGKNLKGWEFFFGLLETDEIDDEGVDIDSEVLDVDVLGYDVISVTNLKMTKKKQLKTQTMHKKIKFSSDRVVEKKTEVLKKDTEKRIIEDDFKGKDYHVNTNLDRNSALLKKESVSLKKRDKNIENDFNSEKDEEFSDDDNYNIDKKTIKKLRKDRLMRNKNRRGF